VSTIIFSFLASDNHFDNRSSSRYLGGYDKAIICGDCCHAYQINGNDSIKQANKAA
jgi:hypothetical protein